MSVHVKESLGCIAEDSTVFHSKKAAPTRCKQGWRTQPSAKQDPLKCTAKGSTYPPFHRKLGMQC